MPQEKEEVDQLLDEHRACLELLNRVEQCLEGVTGPVQDDEALSCLRKLEDTLQKHFKGEEEGFLLQLPLECPHLAARFQKLEDEHSGILDSLSGVLKNAGKPEMDAADRRPGSLKDHVQRLFVTIRRHEAEENELVMEAYWDTLGNID